MAEENQAQQEPQQVTKEPQQVQQQPQQVTSKDPKRVEAGKRLAAINRKKREEQVQSEKGRVNQYYGIGAVLAVGVIGSLGYYLYRTKKEEVNTIPNNPPHRPPQQPPQSNKFEMD